MELRYYRNRLLLLAGALVCFVVFWMAGQAFGIPVFRGFSGSLLMQPSLGAGVAVLVAAVVLVVCAALGTLIAGSIRFDAGFFCAAVGLSAWSLRSGPGRYAIFEAASPSGYLVLAMELVILAGLMALAWSVLWLFHRKGWLAADEFLEGVEDVVVPLNQRLLALLTQAVVTGVLVLVLVQTDLKAQAVISLFVASWLGAWGAHALFPVRPSIWLWTGPLIVGVIGYVAVYASPGTWQLGQAPHALSRPLPLDYASVGPAGALIGYWMSRRALQAPDVEPAT